MNTGAMGMLDPNNPTSFPESHVMSAIFEPIKKDIAPKERNKSSTGVFSQYANMEEPENDNWKFGHKAPTPDNFLLSAVHSFMHKNTFASMGRTKRKGIADLDLEQAFHEKHKDSDDESVASLFSELSEIEFEKPDLRSQKRNIGRDNELFGMITQLAE